MSTLGPIAVENTLREIAVPGEGTPWAHHLARNYNAIVRNRQDIGARLSMQASLLEVFFADTTSFANELPKELKQSLEADLSNINKLCDCPTEIALPALPTVLSGFGSRISQLAKVEAARAEIKEAVSVAAAPWERRLTNIVTTFFRAPKTLANAFDGPPKSLETDARSLGSFRNASDDAEMKTQEHAGPTLASLGTMKYDDGTRSMSSSPGRSRL